MRESLQFYHRSRIRVYVVQVSEALAEWLYRQGQLERAGRLFGAAAAFRTQAGMPQFPRFKQHFDAIPDEVREKLGQAAFGAAWDAGQALGLDTAAEGVLETLTT